MTILRGHRRGMILVMVLWTVVLLLILGAGVTQYYRLDMKRTVFAAQSVRCQWASRAGLETAIAVLNEDDRAADTLTDDWGDPDEAAVDLKDVTLGDAEFTVRVVDEAGKLNVNTATKEQLMGLPYMEEPIADAILDWRDEDDTSNDSGAEAGYYQNLTYPYRIRNGRFKTIRELLLVKGVTEDLLYGEDGNLNGSLDYNERDGETTWPNDNQDDVLDQGWIAFLTCWSRDDNLDASGEARINVNNASQSDLEQQLGLPAAYARWIVDNRDFDGLGDLLADDSPDEPDEDVASVQDQALPLDLQTYQRILDRITVAEGDEAGPKVNVNTAPEEVLATLFEDEQTGRTAALNIIGYRKGLAYGMESIGDLLNVQGMTRQRFKKIADSVTVRSNVFTVYSLARASHTEVSGATVVTEAVVDRAQSPCSILYWYQGASH